MDKNYGRGLVFDVARPFSPQMDSRPHAYDAIPALHKLSLFLEDATTLALGDFRVEATEACAPMFNLGRRRDLLIRAPIVVALPRFHVAGRNLTPAIGRRCRLAPNSRRWTASLSRHGSISIPSPSSTTGLRILALRRDPTCDSTRLIRRIIDLRAARNFKWEVRLDAGWNDNQLSVTYFREDMTSGFRTTSDYRSFTFRDYADETAITWNIGRPPSPTASPIRKRRGYGYLLDQ